jgi:hypothetical protein
MSDTSHPPSRPVPVPPPAPVTLGDPVNARIVAAFPG